MTLAGPTGAMASKKNRGPALQSKTAAEFFAE
jgi:hypothetical protein